MMEKGSALMIFNYVGVKDISLCYMLYYQLKLDMICRFPLECSQGLNFTEFLIKSHLFFLCEWGILAENYTKDISIVIELGGK